MIAFCKKKKVAFISSYLPRQCGIATFTSDLINNTKLAGGMGFEPHVFAMQSGTHLEYDNTVKFKIHKNAKHDYISAAKHINSSDIDLVSVQHEFGLFGGDGGSYLGHLLKRLRKPVITTLHTILEEPPKAYSDSLTDVCKTSDKLIVMNKRGIRILSQIYGVAEEKIVLIPHGIPDLPFADSRYYKRKLGMLGRKTILTFGLLSRNKGIEVMLRALPTIVKTDPSILYIVLGATHPEVVRHEGQDYKFQLEKMVLDLGLQKNVVFYNSFVSNEELFQFLGAADIYVTPYLHREQLTSGTLAFAVGAGKAVVSTPYWAAEELLAQDRGKLVSFGDSKHLAHSILEILSDDLLLLRIRKRAYEYGRSMTWPKVGQVYRDLFEAVSPSLPVILRPTVR
ncbi:MAG: glycosyltransferase [Phycisphaerae bacterium]|nr:glycosyltransferase [Phycisphaerae bacterium]NIP55057.1 glycosyltransferase [Phycisphaerae bacterium]NIS53767.1 glycosyltransferase [Phycisphaerae bacterium]NIU11345.1 glycosyltransferase [Phycisphaerae bacterium]NIU57475.1 glycosyltransferase [Phycisphaerae bacterium]